MTTSGIAEYAVKIASDCHDDDAETAEQPEKGVADVAAESESTMMLLMSAMKNDPTTTPDSSSTRGSSRRPTTRLSR